MQQKFPNPGLTRVMIAAIILMGPNRIMSADENSTPRQPEFLWEISKNHLKNPLQWPSIWRHSPQAADPENIHGMPGLEKGQGPEGATKPVTNIQRDIKNTDWALNEEKRTQRYLEKVRTLQMHGYQAMPAEEKSESPVKQVNEGPAKYYLSQALVLATPFIVDPGEGKGVYPHEAKLRYSASNESEILQLFDEVTIHKGLESGVKVGDLFRTYEVGENYRSFASGRNLGQLVETNGIVQITRVSAKNSVGKLIKCFGTISQDSRACPLSAPPEITATGYSPITDGKQIAQVVLVTQEQQFPQPFSYAIVDRGSMKGFKIGDMVLFYNRIKGRISDKVLGNGLIVNVQAQSSTVLIKDLYPGIINRGDYTVIVQTTVL